MVRARCIAVFDLGKTNKKFVVFGYDLRALWSRSARIGEKTVNGLLCDDIESINSWIRSTLNEARRKFGIKIVIFTTFGATFALVGERGDLTFPVVSYNQEVDPELRRKFYEEFGSPEELYMRTGTPPLGQLLNAGLQLYWIRESYPRAYRKARSLLFLPQYLSYVIAGVKSTEITSVGCHTYLYDLARRGWSRVAEGLGVPEISPPYRDAWEVMGLADGGVRVTPGIHDSNASLIPYLVLGEQGRLVLASTGTWCVFMQPGEPFAPSRNEMYRDVLYYIDVFGRPVRAARFKGGYEFDYYVSLISGHFNIDPLSIPFDERISAELLRKRRCFVVPTLTPGSGQFPSSKGRIVGKREFLKDPRTAYHALNLSLAAQSYFAISLLTRGRRGLRIAVQGGFARNIHYLKFLATLMPFNTIIYYGYPEATSLGAAIVGRAALEGKPLDEVGVEVPLFKGRRVDPIPVDYSYVGEFLREFESRCGGR